MALWSWRTLSDGSVEVDRGQGFKRIAFDPLPSQLAKSFEWRELAKKYADKYGVPLSWVLATIAIESGGNPEAENWCCAGLMAIYWKVHGKKRVDMLDPDKNLDYGVSLLAKSVKLGLDYPQTASVHNAGAEAGGTPHPSTKSPWGMREETPYIERGVKALNHYVDLLGGDQLLPGLPPHVPPPLERPVLRAGFLTPSQLLLPLSAGALLGYLAVGVVTRLAARAA